MNSFYYSLNGKDWKNVKFTSMYDLYFSYGFIRFGICYRPKTILFWIKKILKLN
jgi:hypothetical protein